MTATILKGAEVAAAMDKASAEAVEGLKSKGIIPTLALVRVGERPDDISYENTAIKRAEKVGIAVRQVLLPESVSQDDVIASVQALNTDDSIHGVLMFRPLPAHIDEDTVRNTLVPEKDIDGITDLSLASIFVGADTGYAPCTAQACREILDFFNYDLKGKRVVVIGRSLVVGKPVAMMLLDRHATVTIAHSRTQNIPPLCSQADLVVACVGRFRMLDASYLSPGQTIIDVGINFDEEGTMAGDVDFEVAKDIVQAITPVPGGVGTVTTSTLMKHVAEAAEKAGRAGIIQSHDATA